MSSFTIEYDGNEERVKLMRSSKPFRGLSIKWLVISTGEAKTVDRGPEADRSGCICDIRGTYDYVAAVKDLLKQSISDGAQVIIKDVFTPFIGVDVDYTQPISLYCKELQSIRNEKNNVYSLRFELESGSFSFLSITGQIPSLKALSPTYTGDRVVEFNPSDTIFNDAAGGFTSLGYTTGGERTFRGRFLFDKTEMQELLTFQRVNRGDVFDMPVIPGVDFPFGEDSGTYPLRARLFAIENVVGDAHVYQATVTFTEAEL